MKYFTRIATIIIIVLLFAQSALVVEAKEENKNPDPGFREKATYIEKSQIPYYGKNAVVDTYIADGIFYSVDIATQDVVNIEPEVMSYKVDTTYSEEQLRAISEKLITDFLGNKVGLDKFSYSLGKKIGTYFFRWEDLENQLTDGSYPFIQVGLSQNGDFLNFVNTFPFSEKITSLIKSSNVRMKPTQNFNLIGPFTQVYANGGSYWSPAWSGSSANGGYFGTAPIPAGCSGAFCAKYYYAPARSSALYYGKWTPNANTNTKASAFIPNNNATATVKYEIRPFSGGATIFTVVDQNAYFNAWKNITPSTVGNGISYVRLYDVGFNGTGSSSYKVAWDEIWVYNP